MPTVQRQVHEVSTDLMRRRLWLPVADMNPHLPDARDAADLGAGSPIKETPFQVVSCRPCFPTESGLQEGGSPLAGAIV